MASVIDLIEAFKDTQRMIREDEQLNAAAMEMQAGTMLYLSGYNSIKPKVRQETPVIIVEEDTTFHAAQHYALDGDVKVAVLNFANAYNPGGGVRNGAMAQEECLCRSSNLYASLTMPYILKHYYKWNSKNTGERGTDAVIYSPGVTVFKTDDEIPKIMKPWFQVDVLTCAAPYYDAGKRKPIPLEELKEIFIRRIRNILEIAAANNVDILVLGAFGCGAFHNPPQLVAEAFRYLLLDKGYGKFFDKILFAIKKNSVKNQNLSAFKKVFENKLIYRDTRVLYHIKGTPEYLMTNDTENNSMELTKVFSAEINGKIHMQGLLLGSIFAHDPYIIPNLEKMDCTFEELNPGFFE